MQVGTLSRRVSVNMDRGTVKIRTHLIKKAVPKWGFSLPTAIGILFSLTWL